MIHAHVKNRTKSSCAGFLMQLCNGGSEAEHCNRGRRNALMTVGGAAIMPGSIQLTLLSPYGKVNANMQIYALID